MAPAFAGVSFEGISNNATVSNPIHLDFQVEGMTVKPAGAMALEGLHVLHAMASYGTH